MGSVISNPVGRVSSIRHCARVSRVSIPAESFPREAGQRAQFHDPARGENAREGREEKVILRADRAWMRARALVHATEKIDFPTGGAIPGWSSRAPSCA